MCEDFKEMYAKDGKEISILIQEWINENIDKITYKCKQTESEYRQNI